MANDTWLAELMDAARNFAGDAATNLQPAVEELQMYQATPLVDSVDRWSQQLTGKPIFFQGNSAMQGQAMGPAAEPAPEGTMQSIRPTISMSEDAKADAAYKAAHARSMGILAEKEERESKAKTEAMNMAMERLKSMSSPGTEVFMAGPSVTSTKGNDVQYMRGDGSDSSEYRGGNFSKTSGTGYKKPGQDILERSGLPPQTIEALQAISESKNPQQAAVLNKMLEMQSGKQSVAMQAREILKGLGSSRDPALGIGAAVAQLKALGLSEAQIEAYLGDLNLMRRKKKD